ncbi:MAG: hypothetical protein J5636_06730 [Clostridiales bacterium]|nr:hypothetical protein [Clostridiales bacterium]
MKNSGGRDTFLLFIVLVLALGAVCYLCVIKKNFDKLAEVKDELRVVEAEKAKNDAIIQQAQELDAQSVELKNQIQALEVKVLPDLNTAAIQRKLYKRFSDAGIPFIVEVSNTALTYDTVTMTNGVTSPNRAKFSNYLVQVSGTDGWLLTHDEGDSIPYKVFYNQLGIAPGDETTVNEEAQKIGYNSAKEIQTSTFVGYDEFVAALKEIQADAPDYVKITDIKIEDMKQGFCYYTAVVTVFAYDLVDRISVAPTDMNYMKWEGAEQIATGGLVGLPSYFVVINPSVYKVSPSSPLYGHFISFASYDFTVNRPFAAWNHWAYEWNLLESVMNETRDELPEIQQLEIRYRLGMISNEEYNQIIQEYQQQLLNQANAALQNGTNPTT